MVLIMLHFRNQALKGLVYVDNFAFVAKIFDVIFDDLRVYFANDYFLGFDYVAQLIHEYDFAEMFLLICIIFVFRALRFYICR